MPRITIGVPVYNGASLLRDCLQNLAAQDFADFQVIVSDNASTDATAGICAEVAAADPRFRVITQPETCSAMENFLRVRRAADSPLFAWRAFDDLSTPNFLSALVALHDARPGLALAVPAVVQEFGGARPDRRLRYRPPPSGPRALALLAQTRRMEAGWFYGLWSTAAAARATDEVHALFPDAWGADFLALLHAALNGGIAGTDACAFRQRVIATVRDYVDRPKPTYREMTDRNRRFAAACRGLIDAADLAPAEAAVLRAAVPLFVRRRSHRPLRVFQAGVRALRGR